MHKLFSTLKKKNRLKTAQAGNELPNFPPKSSRGNIHLWGVPLFKVCSQPWYQTVPWKGVNLWCILQEGTRVVHPFGRCKPLVHPLGRCLHVTTSFGKSPSLLVPCANISIRLSLFRQPHPHDSCPLAQCYVYSVLFLLIKVMFSVTVPNHLDRVKHIPYTPLWCLHAVKGLYFILLYEVWDTTVGHRCKCHVLCTCFMYNL